MLEDGPVRFGGRVGETDRRQRRHRAPARPNPSPPSRSSTIRVLASLSVSPSSERIARNATRARSASAWLRHITTMSSA